MPRRDLVPRARAALPRFRLRRSLTGRILAVNIVALVGLAGGIAYLDGFRARLIDQRRAELASQASMAAALLDRPVDDAALAAIPLPRGQRARFYDAAGRLVADSWRVPATPRFRLVDPATQGFPRRSAVAIDRAIEVLTGAREREPWTDPVAAERSAWPEAEAAATTGRLTAAERMGPDRILVLQAAAPVPRPGPGARPVVVLTASTADILNSVRDERGSIALYFLALVGLTLALSAYLARTIVGPLRQLALAAHRVRLGRARDVAVPRLPGRRDEIGALARALADMTATLRQRIDASEAFAADVAHELKNPLASLRSAVEALDTVRAPDARAQLLGVITADVGRLDRLVTDIAGASRLDAELTRVDHVPLDVGDLLASMVGSIAATGGLARGVRAVLDAPRGPARVLADPHRLGQVFRNLIDNAASFSPDGAEVRLAVRVDDGWVEATVDDQGPGVPEDARDAIFARFYTSRPEQAFGEHSGLGLPIARAIVESLDGTIRVGDAPAGGARFAVRLPAA